MIKNQTGFTLIELAMVLFIVAIIFGGILTPLATRLEFAERETTTDRLEEIRENLIGYVLVNGHLPCPDCPDTSASAYCASASVTVDDGKEDGVDGSNNATDDRATDSFYSCATYEGVLPWSTLGLPEVDAWGNRFAYRVSSGTKDFSDNDNDGSGDGTGCGTPTSGISFELCSTGDIDINDADGNSVAQDVPAIVLSYGKNANEVGNPSSTFELENQDGDTTFIKWTYSKDATNEYDDMMIWIPPAMLMYRMVQAEKLP